MNQDTASVVYYPDSTPRSERYVYIATRIAQLELRKVNPELKAFIATLTGSDLQDNGILRRAVTATVGWGDFRYARTLVELRGFDRSCLHEHALLDPDTAGLALLQAWIEVTSDFEIEGPLKLVDQIEDMYMIRTYDLLQYPEHTHPAIALILHQRDLWTLEDVTTFDDSKGDVTEARTEIEDISCKILARCFDAGSYSQQKLLARFFPRYEKIILYQDSRKRLLYHDVFMFSYLAAQVFTAEVGKKWLDFLERLETASHPMVRACAYGKLVALFAASNRQAAEQYFHRSAAILAEEKCTTHLPSLLLNRWSYSHELSQDTITRVTDSAQQSLSLQDVAVRTAAELQAGPQRRLDELKTIHESCSEINDLSTQQELLVEAVKLAESNGFMWPQVRKLLDTILQLFEATDNSWAIMMLKCTYYTAAAQTMDLAEQARTFFEAQLASGKCYPELYHKLCLGAWRACRKMTDHQRAILHAERNFNCSYAELWNNYHKSCAAWRLTDSRLDLMKYTFATTQPGQEDLARFEQSALDQIDFLETWLAHDTAHHQGLVYDKNSMLAAYLRFLVSDLKLEKYQDRYATQKVKTATSQDMSNKLQAVFGRAWSLVMESKLGEAMAAAEDMWNITANDPSLPFDQVTRMTTTFVSVISAALRMHKHSLTYEARKAMVERLYDMVNEDLPALKLSYAEDFVSRAIPFMWTATLYIEQFPERQADAIKKACWYYDEAYKVAVGLTRKLQHEGLRQWLRRRDFGSSQWVRDLLRCATEFFLRLEYWFLAWKWIQRGRAQALQSMVLDRVSARESLLMSLEADAEGNQSLKEEDVLIGAVSIAGPGEYLEAVNDLKTKQSAKPPMPALQAIIGYAPEYYESGSYMDIDDIWALKEFVGDRNIVLVDWFVDTQARLWRLEVCYDHRTEGVRYIWGYITPQRIKAWKEAYLTFPQGEPSPLEYRMKALHQLRPLLTKLETWCQPGDLVVLSPCAELAGIPIHGIPLDGQILIERNPVIYSGGLNLWRECLKRALSSKPATPFLNDACFASAYEQDGFDSERAYIFEHLLTTADSFDSRVLLGEDLSVRAIEQALSTSPWIHYHGHAYYAKTEALNQCLVLGPVSEEEQQTQTRAGTTSKIPFEEELSETEALLSGHLLNGSARLTVADVFAMDLSATSPVIINVACDSGVQDYSLADDPLGLTAALFCAGASAVVGTLWPIRSSSGRAFSTAFYDNLAKQDAGQSLQARHVNIALAFQHATLELKKQKRDPYSWAAFSLQGAPVYHYTSV